eukprot:9246517-Ditylum_brightwellii.AAC.1
MRIHPATIFSLSSSSSSPSARNGSSSMLSNHPAVQSSMIAIQCNEANKLRSSKQQTTNQKKRKQEDNNSSSSSRYQEISSPNVLNTGEVAIELTYLIEPPLMSDWLPGASTNIYCDTSGDEDNSSSSSDSENDACQQQQHTDNNIMVWNINHALDSLFKATELDFREKNNVNDGQEQITNYNKHEEEEEDDDAYKKEMKNIKK